jgi:hypothetical protein
MLKSDAGIIENQSEHPCIWRVDFTDEFII